jgi:hypothetical protein
VTADSHTVTYGDATPSLTYQITGFVLGEDDSVVSGTPVLNTAYTAGTPVADSPVAVTITEGDLAAGNYDFDFVNGAITIGLRPITVTADPNQSKTQGDPDPVFTYQTSGSLFDGDSFTGALTRDPGEDFGIYAILQGTLTAGDNYDITFVGADFTIIALPPGLLGFPYFQDLYRYMYPPLELMMGVMGVQATPTDIVSSDLLAHSTFLYHPLTPYDMTAYDQFILEEGAYEFIERTINIRGHDGLLPILEEIKKKKPPTL